MTDEITAAHPVVQAAAEALAEEFALGNVNGGLYRHFMGSDGCTSFRSASPAEAAAVVAPAVLRALLDEFIACRVCGEAHECRDTTPPGSAARSVSWAHPSDGHVYARPLFNQDDCAEWLKRIIAEVERASGSPEGDTRG